MPASDSRPIRIAVFGKTDVGRNRDHNEDSFIVADLTSGNASLQPEVREHDLGPKGTLLMVADGMGGAAAGEVASEMATKTVFEHMMNQWGADGENTPQKFAYRLKEAVEKTNQAINQYAREHPEHRGMGTTTTAVGILGPNIYLTQVGDSRAYLVRKGSAIQLTKDQSLMQRLIDAGELTEEEAEKSERRNIILQALGPDPKVRVDLTHQEVRRGDYIVICSDGLSGQVKKTEIAAAVAASEDLKQICGQLIELANSRGGPDNITVIVARLDGNGLKDASDDESVGHQVYPLLDTESTTQPVPVYRGSKAPEPKGRPSQ
ncbi:MAG: Stp1/IreP family PP2C-type Ser/Thr phosphatase [Gemmatimonadetes bacterium]|nr:Stp1/IreP family PP2C-type Ser/Thr phosphatase [Gemmatimonadota bacterium]